MYIDTRISGYHFETDLVYVYTYAYQNLCTGTCICIWHFCAWTCIYGVATISRLLNIIGLFYKRALQQRLYSAKDTFNFEDDINHSDHISVNSYVSAKFVLEHVYIDKFISIAMYRQTRLQLRYQSGHSICIHIRVCTWMNTYSERSILVLWTGPRWNHFCWFQNFQKQYGSYRAGMGWRRVVGSLRLQVSFAEYRLFDRAILQRRPVLVRSLRIVAIP